MALYQRINKTIVERHYGTIPETSKTMTGRRYGITILSSKTMTKDVMAS
ncbi:hypothetical protein Goshw_026384 [Gossypium schwendimanii]|uniref:Uncharacterized protein n=1 Tax=Gossypium schwendimanii TaxID=34291 RepID=A0A7J9LC30_GOSSC|nr:hypothetical protein [Gossypium schwendimanii]